MTRFSLIILRSFGVASVLLLLLPAGIQAQNTGHVAEWLESYRSSGSFQQVQALSVAQERADLQSVVDQATILEPDPAATDQLLRSAPMTITFSIPNTYGSKIELELVKTDLLAEGFTVGALGADARDDIPYEHGLHYRGVVRDHPGSLAAISIFDGEIMGFFSDETGAYQLGKLDDGSGKHILYRTQDLKAASPFACFSDEAALVPGEEPTAVEDRAAGCKAVQVYFECDYKMYLDKGSSVTNVTNYVTGFFNQVATLYANENVGIAISQIYVWTSSDPYASYGNTSSVLNAFRATRGTNFTGNLAHFLSTRNLGGGIAYLDVICFKNYAHGVSAINTSYQNVPVFSWTVEVVTHELGHNLGSWHTQSCNWPGGALDNCYPTEGGCSPGPAPANGGTIMSYCHLTNYGINFNNGFGTLPGNRIRDKVQAATCLSASGVAPVGLNAGNITTSSATLSWGIVAGATTYTVQYKTAASSSWITAGNTTSASYNLTGLTANTNYNWQVKTDCSNYSPAASFTTSSNGNGNGGACPVPTGLSNTNITASSAKLNWSAVSGASSYTVQYKRSSVAAWTTAGSTVSTSYTINSLSAASAYNWRVKANCSNYSGTATFVTLSNSNGSGTTCNPPGNLTNLGITAKTAGISWSAVSGASNYTLQIKYASSNTWYTLGTIPVTQVTISGLQPATSYHWRVKASCSGYSSPKLLTTPGFLQDQDEAESAGVVQAPAVHFIRIYPNPASDLLNLQYTGDLLPDSRIMVTDIAGRVVLHESLTQESQTIDISGLQQGVYLLVVMQGNGRKEVERFVKM